MNIKVNLEPFHYIEIDNLYTGDVKAAMFAEMRYHEAKGIFEPPQNTDTAMSEDGTYLKSNTGFFIDNLYSNPWHSAIFTHRLKLLDVMRGEEVKQSWFFNNIFTNWDLSLISYYENKDYYKPHTDEFQYTALTWFWVEPKKFEGGDLIFPDHDITIPCKQDYTLVFPSNIKHEVTPIKMEEEDLGKGLGRFTISQFAGQNHLYDDGRHNN